MSICPKNVNISTNLCHYFKKMSIFQQMYVNISKKCQYFNKSMSIFQQSYVNIKKNINISTNVCQYVKQNSIFQQIYVNISNKCQYFIKFMSNRCRNPPWRRGFRPWGLGVILSAPVQKFRLYVDIFPKPCLHVGVLTWLV